MDQSVKEREEAAQGDQAGGVFGEEEGCSGSCAPAAEGSWRIKAAKGPLQLSA